MIKIVGGGLSGLSLGVFLRKLNVEVQIYEARTYPQHKVCGEFISGVSMEMLEKMGLSEVLMGCRRHGQMRWWIGDKKLLSRRLPSEAISVSRYQLDRDLAKLFKKLGGKLYEGKRVNREDMEKEGLVLGVGKKKSRGDTRWIGLKVHLKDMDGAEIDGLEMHVGKAGYIGLCGVEASRMNCCGLFKVDKSLKGKGSELILNYLQANGLKRLAERIALGHVDEASFSAIAGFSFGSQMGEGEFLLGDAAYLIPPFSGSGMSMAIESSYIAGILIHEFAKGHLSWNQCRDRYIEECRSNFSKRMKLAQQLHPFFFSHFGQTSMKVLAKVGLLPVNTLFKQLRTP